MGTFDEPTQNVELPAVMARGGETRPYITVYSGLEEGHCLPVTTGILSMGRGDDCVLTFQESGISRKHALLSYEDGVVSVSDLGSTNGTFVNHERISHRALTDGDLIQMGGLQLKLRWLDQTDAAFAMRQYRSAKHDTLTGCYNKRHVLELLKYEFAFIKRHDRALSVLMVDLDYFKNLNDTHGHLAGDAVLAKVGELLRIDLRTHDLIARFGGEEFIIVLRETVRPNAVLVAERLRQRIEGTEFEHDGKVLHVTTSVGVATYPDTKVESPEALIERADRALYTAKDQGRNQVAY